MPTATPTPQPKAEVPYVTMTKYMPVGTTFKIPVYNTKGYEVNYSSAKASIATVDTKGEIKAKKKGTTTISCIISTKDGDVVYKVSIKLIVTKKTKKGAVTTFNKYTSKIKDVPYLVLNKKLHPGSNTDLVIKNLKNEYSVKIDSSNKKIVTATKDGTINAKKAGRAVLTITIQSVDKKYVYVYNVTVVKE